jgi:hypothetical protein
LAKRTAAIDSTIDRYLKELDRADREQEVTGVPVPAAKVARLAQGIETLMRTRRSSTACRHGSISDPMR